MCFYKSNVKPYDELMAHYNASFDPITQELDLMKEMFSVMISKDSALNSIGLDHPYEPGMQLIQCEPDKVQDVQMETGAILLQR